MPKKEAPLTQLNDYLPQGSGNLVLEYLYRHKIHLTITKERKSILGDYRHATSQNNHRISVNGSLNKYAFLITLIHELGHLITFMKYGNRAGAHGKEWKLAYRHILEDFISLNLFPPDIKETLERSLHNLPASSCADERLIRVLRKYDVANELLLVEQIEEGNLFSTEKGKLFRKGKRIRKRIECTEVQTGKLYLFSPVYEVKAIS